MIYRKEIDGLRALAVLPVILYHAGLGIFNGGFVGVDIFFVISGYLITTILINDLDQQRFSILDFYERRARRILPALFLVLLVSLVAAWWLLPAKDMKSFSNGLVAVSLFASNILFRITTNYFDSTSDLNPLIHTWSLAVEEQYYVFFPLLLMLLWKVHRRWILPVLLTLFIASLILAQSRVAQHPVATFFLLPSRMWELLVGALIAYHTTSARPLQFSLLFSLLFRQLISMLGLGMIGASVFLFNDHVPTPSIYTLIPTLGAGMILLAADQQTLVGRWLGCRWLVGIGLISYSAYLWHHPLFAFTRHAMLEEPTTSMYLALVALTLLRAVLSWKLVETPFRSKQQFTRMQIFSYAVIGGGLFLLIGLAGHFSKGFEFRLPQEKAAYLDFFENSMPEWRYFNRVGILQAYRIQCDFYDIEKSKQGESTSLPVAHIADECFVRDRKQPHSVMIWGDSHAQHLYGGLAHALPPAWQILQVASSGCEPRLQARQNPQDYCATSNWFALQTIAKTVPDVVIIAQNKNQNPQQYQLMAKQLRQMGVRQVLVIGPTPHWRRDLPKMITYWLWKETPRRTTLGLEPEVMQRDRALKTASQSLTAYRYISMIDDFCNQQGCLVYLGTDRKLGLTTWDYGHLTPAASDYFARQRLVSEITQASTDSP